MQERGGERRTGRPRRRHGARRVALKKRTRGATRSPKRWANAGSRHAACGRGRLEHGARCVSKRAYTGRCVWLGSFSTYGEQARLRATQHSLHIGHNGARPCARSSTCKTLLLPTTPRASSSAREASLNLDADPRPVGLLVDGGFLLAPAALLALVAHV
ncbi:unnamed protein product [Prorocentrum cordatum]|uniref:AP2/ERF domain-containing protein n=1 Tax=Prorocentrum cordatum TaxID=2364126 RepID=A0ABN9SJR0_9DINO|nr:unnamed protein product [Polarella glacialis]